MAPPDTNKAAPSDVDGNVFLRRALVGASLAALLPAAMIASLRATANGYPDLGYWRSVLLVCADAVRLAVPWGAGLALLGGLVAAWLVVRRRDAVRGFALGLGTAAALGALLRVGYVFNRYHVNVNWSWKREWNGMQVPGFLWETGVLLQNAALVAGAALAAWILYRILWLVARRATALRRGVASLLDAWALVVIAGVLLGGTLLAAELGRRSDARAPSFLVISLDTLRADHLGCYGYDRPTSPVIDALAAESVLFEWTISQAEATLPSHMSLFTSEIPSTHGVWNYHYELPEPSLTLAEVLREEGYRTAAFVDAGHMLGLFGFTQGFDHYDDRFKRLEGSFQRGLEWLDGLGHDEPFFLFLHGYDIHTPYAPWSPHRDLFVDPGYDGDFEPTVKAMGEIGWNAREDPDYVVPLSDADRDYVVACYDAAIRWADDLMKRLLDALAARGALEDTWVVVLSDHGEEFLEHGSVEHDKLYHTVTHVPLIVRPPDGEWPDGWEPAAEVRGRRVEAITSLVDVYPTILELAGIPAPAHVEGRSLVPFLGPAPARTLEPAPAYSQSWRFGHQRAITSDTLHAIESLLGVHELEVYAYRRDRLEQASLTAPGAGEPSEAVRELARRLHEWMQSTSRAMDENVARRLLGSDFETLRNLGYIQ